MAGLLDLYGSDTFTDQQKAALQQRGLLGFLAGMQKSGALDYTAPFLSGKVPGGFAAALAGGAGGMGEAQDSGALRAMQAQELGLKAQQLRANLGLQNEELNFYRNLQGGQGGAPSTAGPSTAGPGGASAPTGDLLPTLVKQSESGGDYNIGFGGTDLSNAPKREDGFPIWEGKQGPAGISHAAGAYQFQPATWAEYAGPLGIKDFSPASQDKVFQAAVADKGLQPWMANPKIAALVRTGQFGGSGSSMPPQGGILPQMAQNAPAQPTGSPFAQLTQGQPPMPSPQPQQAPAASGGMMPGGAIPGMGMTSQQAQYLSALQSFQGRQSPDFVNKTAGLPLVGPTAAATAEAENASKYKYAGPIAGAEAAAKLPYTIDRVRPGDVQTLGGVPQFSVPQLTETQDPLTGRMMRTYMTPPMPGMQGRGVPGLGQPTGGAAAGSAPAGEIAKLGPGEISEREHIGKTLGSEYETAVKGYDAAQKALPALDALQNALPTFRTGPLAGNRLEFGKVVQDLAQGIGASMGPEFQKWVSSGEIISKEGTRLGFELARTLGSREAQMIVQQAITTNPGLANSPQGNEKLIGLIKQGLQRDVDRRAFYDQWIAPQGGGHGSLAGAATAFDKASPANLYVSQVLPLHPKTPGDLKGMAPGTKYFRGNDESSVYTVPGAQ